MATSAFAERATSQEPLAILVHAGTTGNIQTWNDWRKDNPHVLPQLAGADLAGLDLRSADFGGVDLSSAQLPNTKLQYAVFYNGARGANLIGANLSGADLQHADMRCTALNRAIFKNAKLEDANLADADLRDCIDLVLDDCLIRNARFSLRAPDPWSVLRRVYTGPRLFLNLLFMLLYLLPYLASVVFWTKYSGVPEVRIWDSQLSLRRAASG